MTDISEELAALKPGDRVWVGRYNEYGEYGPISWSKNEVFMVGKKQIRVGGKAYSISSGREVNRGGSQIKEPSTADALRSEAMSKYEIELEEAKKFLSDWAGRQGLSRIASVCAMIGLGDYPWRKRK